MIKAFFLLFEPAVAWERIALAKRSVVFILLLYLVPTLLIISGVEGWGLVTMGKWQPCYQKIREFKLPEHLAEVVTFETVQFLLSLATVFVSALLIKTVGGTFRESDNFRQAFAVVAYAMSPMFLVRLLDAAPSINPFVTWAIGIGLTVWVLYQGLPRVMMPDPTHAFGLYLSAAIVIVLTTGVARVFTALYILGTVDFQHSWLTHKISHLLGQ